MLTTGLRRWLPAAAGFAGYLGNHGIDFIDPIPLVSPKEVAPPAELSALHFNDWILAFRSGRAT